MLFKVQKNSLLLVKCIYEKVGHLVLNCIKTWFFFSVVKTNLQSTERYNSILMQKSDLTLTELIKQEIFIIYSHMF